MNDFSRSDDAPLRFGTPEFYASIGRAFVVMCAVVPVLFLVQLLNWATQHSLSIAGGIQPREFDHIAGVVVAPLLHWSFEHVYANSIPLIMLGTFALADGVRRFAYSTGVIVLVAGIGTWIIGSDGIHAGASGVVFGFLGLVLARGVVERSWWHAAAALLVAMLYWGMLSGMAPQEGPISWEGHLCGFIGGVLAAILFRRRRRRVRPAAGGDPTIPLPDFDLPR